MKISHSKIHEGHEDEYPNDEYLFTYHGKIDVYDIYHSKEDRLFVARYGPGPDLFYTDEYQDELDGAISDEQREVFAIAYQHYFWEPHPVYADHYKDISAYFERDPSVSPNSKSFLIPRSKDVV